MELLVIIYILVFIVFALVLYSVMQMKLLGIKIVVTIGIGKIIYIIKSLNYY